MPEYRLFIAIELPAVIKSALETVQQTYTRVAAVRWTTPQQIHLTLQFLGNVPIKNVEHIIAALRASKIPTLHSFDLTLATVGAFPNTKRPRIIWVGVTTNEGDSFNALYQSVIASTQTVGFEPEHRAFKPHLTIGRVQKWARARDYRQIEHALGQTNVGQIGTFRVTHISLIRSQLTKQGPIYTTLAKVFLTENQSSGRTYK